MATRRRKPIERSPVVALRLDGAQSTDAHDAMPNTGVNMSEFPSVKSAADQAKYHRALAEELAAPLYTDDQEDAIMAARTRRHLAWQEGDAL